jgi:hypothetical protein
MTLHEAYLKAKNYANPKGTYYLKACGDYGAFWGFFFMLKGREGAAGFGDITVDKKTGKLGSFIPTMDFDLYDKRVDIPIEQFADYNVAV